jgi:GMP synthase-like glutamine amidotransferase
MIVYVVFAQDDEVAGAGNTCLQHKLRFEELSGEPCLIARHKDFRPQLLAELRPTAVVMGGFGRSFDTFGRRHLIGISDAVKRTPVPTLGICGSHQLIAMLFNGNIRRAGKLRDEPMRKLRAGEADLQPSYHPGYFKETGFHHVRVVKDDSLFAGLNGEFVCLEAHYCEVKKLPKGFELLASTDECQVQAYRHPKKPLYGVQFHPEGYTDHYPDGRKVLESFFRLAGTKRFARRRRKASK